MTASRMVISFAWMICTSVTTADTPRIPDQARNPGVKRWISYEIIGPRNHPFPIVYLSTQEFEILRGESLIVLPQQRYDIISADTQARIARPDCPGNEAVGPVWYSVKITAHEKHTRHCVLPRALACHYLSGVVKLSGINWTVAELRPITDFMEEDACNASG